MTEPTIPHGFKRIYGQAQKGDGMWDGVRFRKVQKVYPTALDEAALARMAANISNETGLLADDERAHVFSVLRDNIPTSILIRKCAEEQQQVPGVAPREEV